jgi:hypothetical protein
MGAIYKILLPKLEPEAMDWMMDNSIEIPKDESRLPTPNEIIATLKNLDIVKFSHFQSGNCWQVPIDSNQESWENAWTLLRVNNFKSFDHPHEFHFEAGWPEMIILITFELSKTCGPFVLSTDEGRRMSLVSPEIEFGRALSWLMG